MTEIPIEKIKVVKNTRTEIGDVSELMADIRENGLLEPIGVWMEDGEYYIAYGHRRFQALRKLGRKSLVVGDEVKVLSKKLNSRDLIVINLVENLHRVDNSPVEFAKGCRELRDMGLSNSEIAARLSVPKVRIETAMRIISNVPKKYEKDIGYVAGSTSKKGKIPSNVAARISTFRMNRKDTEKMFEYAKKNEVTIDEVDMIKRMVAQGGSFKQSVKVIDKYDTTTIKIVYDKEEAKKLGDIRISKFIIDVLKGKREPIPELFY